MKGFYWLGRQRKRQETQTIKSEISQLLMDARKVEWGISERGYVWNSRWKRFLER